MAIGVDDENIVKVIHGIYLLGWGYFAADLHSVQDERLLPEAFRASEQCE
jgi:hypothetical protein